MASVMADSIAIDVPAEFAWQFLADPRRVQPVVSGGQTTVRLLSGSFEAVGSRYLVTTRAGGQVIDATHEITRLEPPRVLATRITSQGSVATSLLQVEPVGPGRCVVIMQGEVEWGGSFWMLVARVVSALFGRATLRRALGQLRTTIEMEHRRSVGLLQPDAHLGEEG
jgi:carbon monoxide dehydrogenase subunit G